MVQNIDDERESEISVPIEANSEASLKDVKVDLESDDGFACVPVSNMDDKMTFK